VGDMGGAERLTFGRLLNRSAIQFSMSAAGKMLAGAAMQPRTNGEAFRVAPPAPRRAGSPTCFGGPAQANGARSLDTRLRHRNPSPHHPLRVATYLNTFRARPPRQQGSPRWLSPPSLAGEAQDPSTLPLAFEGSCTAPPALDVSGHLLVPPGRWPSTPLCIRRPSFYLSDGANRRSPVLPGRRRLRGGAGGPTSFGDLPSPGLGPLAAAPPLRPVPPAFSARRSPVSRDFAPTRGFKQRGAQIAEQISMPASRHPDRSLSPLIGGCSNLSVVGAQPTSALTPGAPA
jgi:hypothetical protein